MLKWLLIAAGGGAGSMLRYAMQGWVGQEVAGRSFPLGTMCVNILGCLIMGFVSGLLVGPYLIREEYHFAIRVGLLGGFTTFSSFGLETFSLTNDREFGLAALNMVLSCAIGLAAVWFGYRVAERWFGV